MYWPVLASWGVLKPKEETKVKEKVEEKEESNDNNIEKTSMSQEGMQVFIFNGKFDNDYFSDFYDEFWLIIN